MNNYLTQDWEFNVLGIYNYLKPGRFDAVLKFIRENFQVLDWQRTSL